jgi:hypothetical protein
MAISLSNLPSGAKQIWTAFAAALTELGVSLPERQYRAAGSMIVWDDEQFTVALMGIAQGQPGVEFGGTYIPPSAATYHASFSVNLVRKITVFRDEGTGDMEIPTPEQQDSDGANLMSDGAALILAAQAIHEACSQAPGGIVDPGQGFVIGPLAPLGPEGGLAANRLLISLSLS